MMMNNHNDTHVGTGLKVALAGVILLVVLFAGGVFILPMLQTVGGSFGYGYPGTSGGRAIRDVVIDVEPQVVYRIDDHRFFTFENYLDCDRGGFVYYNDTNRKIKTFAGVEGGDKRPQNEFSLTRKNSVLSFYGRFVYSASDKVIAYPGRNINYKYGDSTYFVISRGASEQSKGFGSGPILPGDTVFITDEAIYVQSYSSSGLIDKITPEDNGVIKKEWVSGGDFNFKKASQDDRFHCDNTIKPKKVKYPKN